MQSVRFDNSRECQRMLIRGMGDLTESWPWCHLLDSSNSVPGENPEKSNRNGRHGTPRTCCSLALLRHTGSAPSCKALGEYSCSPAATQIVESDFSVQRLPLWFLYKGCALRVSCSFRCLLAVN